MPGISTSGVTALPSEIADDDLLLVARDNVVSKIATLDMPNGLTARRQLVAPLISDFSTAVNSIGYADVQNIEDGIRMFVDRRPGDQVFGYVRTLPGGSWDVSMGFVRGFRHGKAQGGLLLRESGTGKLVFQSYGVDTVPGWFTSRYTNPTTFGAILTNRDERGMGIMWQRFVLNGSNIDLFISVDGFTWKNMGSIALTAGFTTAPDQWGFMMNSGAIGLPITLDIIDWDE